MHSTAPLAPGDRVMTYDGPGVITAIVAWFGDTGYRVKLDNGSVNTFDASRIRRSL